jgi:hypothetical protein
MTNLEWASWVLTGLTGVLAFGTIWYAIETYKMNMSSKTTQSLLEKQNDIMAAHNQSLKEQSDAQHNLVGVLGDIGVKLIRMTDEISDAGQAIDNFRTMFRMEKLNEIRDEAMKKMKHLP